MKYKTEYKTLVPRRKMGFDDKWHFSGGMTIEAQNTIAARDSVIERYTTQGKHQEVLAILGPDMFHIKEPSSNGEWHIRVVRE